MLVAPAPQRQGVLRNHCLSIAAISGKALRMNEQRRDTDTPRTSREERLAARLRENLRLRKAQARAISTGPDESPAQGLSKPTGDS